MRAEERHPWFARAYLLMTLLVVLLVLVRLLGAG